MTFKFRHHRNANQLRYSTSDTIRVCVYIYILSLYIDRKKKLSKLTLEKGKRKKSMASLL